MGAWGDLPADQEGMKVMEKSLQIVKSSTFDGVQFDCYRGNDEDWYGTREQIGMMLEYADPAKAIANIHDRNKERLDKFSGTLNLRTPGGIQSTTVYSFKGLLEICRYSNQPKADAVMDFLWNMADEVRKTGGYSVKGDDKLDIQRKRLALQEKNANARLAKIMQRMVEHPAYPITDDSKRVLVHEITALTTGKEHAEMLPDSDEKLRSNSDLGAEMGISNRKIMKQGRSLGLVAPEGQANEFGVWKMSKSPNSPHECSQWYWKEKGRKKLLNNNPAA
jgi:prophage antirepressor-like protein